MKLPFITKYNGVYYNAFEEIPTEDKSVPVITKSEVEEKIEEKVDTKKVSKPKSRK